MKKIAVLGSTGSIGTQALDVAERYPEEFCIEALSCGHNIALLREQIKKFSPAAVCVAEEKDAAELAVEFPGTEFMHGEEGLCSLAAGCGAEMVLNGLLGMMGIRPTLAAIEAGKDIAFANKETLVAGGSIIVDAVKRKGVRFLPVDSEHSAVFQALSAAGGNKIRKIILTASGGPFRGFDGHQLAGVTKAMALKHPNWSMGAKITIDSATMMNKGLEIIEASWLFDMPADKIEVVVHPESAVHSAIEFEDGSIIAQIGAADMRIPIAYALSYPGRLPEAGRKFSFTDLGRMTFEKPDPKVFRCLGLAYEAIEKGGSYPVVLNSANEEAVAAFLKDRISFVQIADCVEAALDAHSPHAIGSVDDILDIEKEARAYVLRHIDKLT